jgi:hypothetical protein
MPDYLESVLTPVLALILWTFVVWVWMYVTRIPAMARAGIDAGKIQRAEDLAPLPVEVHRVADNYNHLHEQPTVFYALAVYTHLAGPVDALSIGLAWAYVGLRVAHSLVQVFWNYVPVRFVVFALSTLVLMALAGQNVLHLMAGASAG